MMRLSHKQKVARKKSKWKSCHVPLIFMINKIFKLERGNITLLDFDKEKSIAYIKFKNKRYDIGYYIDDDGDVALLQNSIANKITMAWQSEPIVSEWLEFANCPDWDDDWSCAILGNIQEELEGLGYRESIAKMPIQERLEFQRIFRTLKFE